MKITLTHDEVKQLLANRIKMGLNMFELNISDEPENHSKSKLLDELIVFLKNCNVFAPNGEHRVFAIDKKMDAIKGILDFYNYHRILCGFEAAKSIVEQWDRFVVHCHEIGGFVTNPDALPWQDY